MRGRYLRVISISGSPHRGEEAELQAAVTSTIAQARAGRPSSPAASTSVATTPARIADGGALREEDVEPHQGQRREDTGSGRHGEGA